MTRLRLLAFSALLAAAIAARAGATTIAQPVVYFDSGSDALQPQALPILDDLATAMTNPMFDIRILIEGRADRAGQPRANRLLSCRRARAVRAHLLARGVAPERLAIRGRGEDAPYVETEDGVPERHNRFVMMTFVDEAALASARAQPDAC